MTEQTIASAPLVSPADAAFLDLTRDLFGHDRYANEQVFDTLATITPAPVDAIARMAHLVGCLELWISRFDGKGNPSTPLIWPDWSLEETRERNTKTHDQWVGRLNVIDSAELSRVVRCVPMAGGHKSYEVSVKDVLIQLPQHGAYHRGQVSVYIKDTGAKPLEVDYIYGKCRFVED